MSIDFKGIKDKCVKIFNKMMDSEEVRKDRYAYEIIREIERKDQSMALNCLWCFRLSLDVEGRKYSMSKLEEARNIVEQNPVYRMNFIKDWLCNMSATVEAGGCRKWKSS